MTRARREETERAIMAAAWDLFRQKGCYAASYSDLAEVSGVSRPLVQRYYPKKSLLVDACLVAVRDASVEVCNREFSGDVHPIAWLYLLGQVNIAAYFADEGMRRFLTDVFSSRELTRKTVEDSFQWTVEHTLPACDDVSAREEPDEVLMSFGGLYELVYAYLVTGRMPDVPRVTLPSVVTYARFCDVPLPAGWTCFEDMLSPRTIPEKQLSELAKRSIELVSERLSPSH